MAAKTEVPITGSVLSWAIAESGMTREELAGKLGVSVATIQAWEREQERPGKTEFADLAEKLRRPTATFFLPEPPPHRPVDTNFRATPGRTPRGIKPEEARWLRRADELRELLAWVRRQIGSGPLRLPWATLDDPPVEVAARVREELGVAVETQTGWGTPLTALEAWRAAIEGTGALVFEFDMGVESARGFTLWDELAPVIALNRSGHVPASRIYTLIHEYGHLVLRTTSVCIGYVALRSGTRGARQEHERWCDRFAAAVLLPAEALRDAVEERLSRRGSKRIREVRDASALADYFNVSLLATTVRLIDLDLAPKVLYPQVVAVTKQHPTRRRSSAPPSPPRSELRIRQYGYEAVGTVVDAVARDVLTPHEAMEALDVGGVELNVMADLLDPGS